jgi:endonuclease/exonuclease/phosphatase family metal-dependent hydrolase
MRMLTLNMMGLPQPLGGDETRYADIVDAMGEYDVVTIQEAFTQAARDALRGAPFPHQKFGNFGELPGARLGDGLVVLSRYPIVSTAFTTYDDCFWTDCLARKGVLLVRLDVDGVEVDVYTTHLQSMLDDSDGRSVRAGQVKEFNSFVSRTSRGNPSLLLGDFNARASQYTVTAIVDGLGVRDLWAEHGGASGDVSATYCEENGCERIDYIFARQGRYHDVRATRMRVRLKDPVGGRQLSDHFAVEADIEVTVRPSEAALETERPTSG